MRILTLFILVLQCCAIWCQDSVLVTKNFSFENGIYLSFESLKNNKPDHKWETLTSTYFTNPTTLLAEVKELRFKENEKLLPIKEVYAISIKGVPYINSGLTSDAKMAKFYGLKIRGVLGYYSFEEKVIDKIKIQAYNPINGQPFRTGFVEKERTKKIEKTLSWLDGKISDFNQENLMKYVQDDLPLLNSIKDLEDWEVEEKLFKCLLIYNDRHAIYVPKRSL